MGQFNVGDNSVPTAEFPLLTRENNPPDPGKSRPTCRSCYRDMPFGAPFSILPTGWEQKDDGNTSLHIDVVCVYCSFGEEPELIPVRKKLTFFQQVRRFFLMDY